MRLVSREVQQAMRAAPHAPANFGLVFNKMLEYTEDRGQIKPTVHQDRRPLIPQYDKGKKAAADVLRQRHIDQATYCQAMERAGWRPLVVHARLASPFISGLGANHPTETGLVLDHTSGVPYIPATSQKGVMRLAHIVNALQDEKGNWLEVARNEAGDPVWEEDAQSLTLFGRGGDDNALAGQMVVLDAYPLRPPELGEEILNPHYGDYYKGNRPPTEDQLPIPVRFLVVRPGAEFVFRVLLRLPLAKAPIQDMEGLAATVRANLERALTEEGMGAKTALGLGRFTILAEEEPAIVIRWLTATRPDWEKCLDRIRAIQDWGQLHQFLDGKEAARWKEHREVAEALRRKAEEVRGQNLKKWREKGEERDRLLAEWLAAAGASWQPLAPEQGPGKEEADLTSSPLVEKIRAYADWGAYNSDPVDMTALDKPALLALQQRFKDWGCNSKKAKNEKKAAWKELRQRLRQVG